MYIGAEEEGERQRLVRSTVASFVYVGNKAGGYIRGAPLSSNTKVQNSGSTCNLLKTGAMSGIQLVK